MIINTASKQGHCVTLLGGKKLATRQQRGCQSRKGLNRPPRPQPQPIRQIAPRGQSNFACHGYYSSFTFYLIRAAIVFCSCNVEELNVRCD